MNHPLHGGTRPCDEPGWPASSAPRSWLALLLPQAALAAAPTGSTVTPATAPTIRLACALVIPAAHPRHERIVCHWSALTGVDVRAYRVWRIVDPGLGRPRELVATVTPGEPLRSVDRDISRGHTYAYRVAAIGGDGSRVGVSNLVSVRVGWHPEHLALGCAYVIDATRQGALCHWSKADRPAAARFVLVRSVDNGPRQRIYRTGIDGRRSYFDTDLKAGQTVRYRVFALARDGRVVGVSDPDVVVVPTIVVPDGCRVGAIPAVDTGTLAGVDGRADDDGDERTLVERAKVDPAAFAELYRRYLPRVHAFAVRRTGRVEAAEDVTSAAFESALRHIGTFTWRPGGFGPWLFRIVANELADHHRRTGRAASARSLAAARRLDPDDPADPADLVGARDEVAEVLDAMDRLNPRYQRALSLRYLAGLSADEAAAAMGTSKATLAVVVFRATRALRRELEREGGS